LEDRFTAVDVSAPSKLDSQCVDLSFKEMRLEGFANDGLFDRMKRFFLPLTIVEQDLEVSNDRWEVIANRLTDKKNTWEKDLLRVKQELATVEERYSDYDNLITNTKKTMNISADDHQFNSGCQQQIIQYRQMREQLEPKRSELRSQLIQINDMMKNIDEALSRRTQNSSSRDLVKPNRGFIMYGPPGK
jgi:hypothetical protein